MKAPEDLAGVWRVLGGAFRIRFGGGAVGRLGQITIWGGVLIVVMGIVAVLRDPTLTMWALGALVVFLILGLAAALSYCLLYPQYAALGDTQMERVMRHDQGARGLDQSRLPAAVQAPIPNPLLIDQAVEPEAR